VLRIQSKNPAQNVFELAGAKGDYKDPRARGAALARSLNRYGPGGSRTIWPAVEQWASRIEDEIEDIFQDYADRVNRAAKRAA